MNLEFFIDFSAYKEQHNYNSPKIQRKTGVLPEPTVFAAHKAAAVTLDDIINRVEFKKLRQRCADKGIRRSQYDCFVPHNRTHPHTYLQNDIYYVEHLSFLFDLKVIWLTIKTVLSHKDVYRA